MKRKNKNKKSILKRLGMHVKWVVHNILDMFEVKAKSKNERVYGWKRSKPDSRDFMFCAAPSVMENLPEKVDLRKPVVPIFDQGKLGSCTAQSISSAFIYEYTKQCERLDFIPSRLFIYYNEREMEGTINQDCGAQIRDGVKSMAIQGSCDESSWPYIISNFAVRPSDKCYVEALSHQVLQYSQVVQTLDQIKSCLASGYPIILGIRIYESFESVETARSGVVNLPRNGERCLGGHAVLCVGYDNITERFIMQNSWGQNWGQKGYFTIPYSYLLNNRLAADFWSIKLVEK